MKLNIETVDPQATLASLKRVYENVEMLKAYKSTADYEISDKFHNGERVWPLEGLLQLPHCGIPIEKIRIY